LKRVNKTILVTMALGVFAILIASAVTAAPVDPPNDAPGEANYNEGELGENDGGGGQNQNNLEGEYGEGELNQNQNP